MSQQKSRSDILLEERIAQIDDINFDKIYDVDEFAIKQIEDFDEMQDLDIQNISSMPIEDASSKEDNIFEVELQPNEFLDNHIWQKDEEEEEQDMLPSFDPYLALQTSTPNTDDFYQQEIQFTSVVDKKKSEIINSILENPEEAARILTSYIKE